MLQTPDSAIVQTLLNGTTDGSPFNALVALGWPAGDPLNMDHPIEKIEVLQGALAVDALNITYVLKDKTTKQINHGAQTGVSTTINLGADEVVIDVSGRAGYHTSYNRVVLCQISFVILNKKTSDVRVSGPYGGSGQGDVFHDSGTAAFAGWETTYNEVRVGGLSFWTPKAWE